MARTVKGLCYRDQEIDKQYMQEPILASQKTEASVTVVLLRSQSTILG